MCVTSIIITDVPPFTIVRNSSIHDKSVIKLLMLRILVLFTLSGEVASNLQPAGVTGVSVVLLGMVLLLSIFMSKLVKPMECAHYINLALLEVINLILELHVYLAVMT